MSVRIKGLETELGQRLFDRARKGVALTEAGAVLYRSAEKIFADVEDALQQLGELAQSRGGLVRVGASDTVSLYLLPPILRAFRKQFPVAEITIRNAYTAEILDLLVRGDLDCGVVTRPLSIDRRLEARVIREEPFVIVSRLKDPLLRRRTVSLAALDDRPWVALAKGTETRDAVDRALRAAGAKPRVVLETGNVEVQKRYVAEGFGCAILPASAVAEVDGRTLKVRPLEGDPLRRKIVVVLRRDRHLSRAAAALIELLDVGAVGEPG